MRNSVVNKNSYSRAFGAFRLFSLAVLLILFTSSPVITRADTNGNQIRFSVKHGTFTFLSISGTNQNGDGAYWDNGNPSYPQYWSDTTDYWWVGSVELTFYVVGVGMRQCHIDNLRDSTVDNIIPVVYTEGLGCTGDAGNSDNSEVFVEQLDNALNNKDDSMAVYGAVTDANDAAQCIAAIVNGLNNQLGVIRVGWECGNASLSEINAVLSRHDTKVVKR